MFFHQCHYGVISAVDVFESDGVQRDSASDSDESVYVQFCSLRYHPVIFISSPPIQKALAPAFIQAAAEADKESAMYVMSSYMMPCAHFCLSSLSSDSADESEAEGNCAVTDQEYQDSALYKIYEGLPVIKCVSLCCQYDSTLHCYLDISVMSCPGLVQASTAWIGLISLRYPVSCLSPPWSEQLSFFHGIAIAHA